ncbi:unnamed protein product, partial [Sphacelaria rigidula]
MDIKQGLSAVAAVTLGKDMTFRDYAQGAFRMRGIGKGQKVQVLIIPEVQRLIASQVAAGEGTTRQEREQRLQVLRSCHSHRGKEMQILRDICGWLNVNSMRAEKVK